MNSALLQLMYDEDVRRTRNLIAFGERAHRQSFGLLVMTDNWRESKALTDNMNSKYRIGTTISVRLPKRWEPRA